MQSETDGNEEGERNGLSVFNARLPVPADEQGGGEAEDWVRGWWLRWWLWLRGRR